jgi:hypothetical protein
MDKLEVERLQEKYKECQKKANKAYEEACAISAKRPRDASSMTEEEEKAWDKYDVLDTASSDAYSAFFLAEQEFNGRVSVVPCEAIKI